MKKNTTTKIVAIIALLAILIGVLGTGINFILNMGQNANGASESQLTPEQLEELKKAFDEQNKAENNLETNTDINSENNIEN